MNKKTLLIAVFVISLIGLAIVQYQYLGIGLNLASVQFAKKVETASKAIKEELRYENKLTYLIASAVQQDTTFFTTTPDSLSQSAHLFFEGFLKDKLEKNGIDAAFVYQLKSKESNVYLKSNKQFNEDVKIYDYNMALEGYIPEVLGERVYLNLKFKNLNRYFLSKLNGLTLPSLIFLVCIVLITIWGFRTFYWQQRIIANTDDFINNLTHELKTPVYSIQLATKILEEKTKDGDKTFLNIITQQTKRLGSHIDKVLELASMDRKKNVFQLKPLDFKPVLEKLCKEFEALVSLEQVGFTFNLVDSDYTILGEAFHLENTIKNLLDNAKKYAENPIIELNSFKKNNHLIIRVKDNGIGIPQKDIHKVFQKYFRGNQSNLHGVKGFGLGLNYAYTVVKKHNGKIVLDSKENIGTTVTIKIPLNES